MLKKTLKQGRHRRESFLPEEHQINIEGMTEKRKLPFLPPGKNHY